MTAAPVRLAHSDTQAPHPELAAVGSVTVNGNGSADLPRMGPPRPRSSDTVLTPARQALAAHQANLAALGAEVERTQKPVSWLRDKLTAATSDLQQAEAKLASIDAAHAHALTEAARAGASAPALPPSSADVEAALQRARRNVNSVRQALTEVEVDLQRANQNLEAARSRGDVLVLACLVEDHDSAVRFWDAKRSEYFDAEATVLGLLECIGETGRSLEARNPGAGLVWLRQLERLRDPAGKVPVREEFGPRDIAVASNRWSAVLHRLGSDPSATF